MNSSSGGDVSHDEEVGCGNGSAIQESEDGAPGVSLCPMIAETNDIFDTVKAAHPYIDDRSGQWS